MTDACGSATNPSRDAGSSTVTVMIAVDGVGSVDVIREAHRLFGDGARYLVVNVGPSNFTSMRWAGVYPVGIPGAWFLPSMTETSSYDEQEIAAHEAEFLAADVAHNGDLPNATTVGAIGDPANAIIRAAHEHDADVLVIGGHQHSWLSRLFTPSVERNVLREADIAVLVVRRTRDKVDAVRKP